MTADATDPRAYEWPREGLEGGTERLPGIRWGDDLERDCRELRRLEAWGLYASGHHDANCGHCLSTPDATPCTDAAIQAATEALRFCGPDRCLNVEPCGELCWIWTEEK